MLHYVPDTFEMERRKRTEAARRRAIDIAGRLARGERQSDIARSLNTTRQVIHNVLDRARKRGWIE